MGNRHLRPKYVLVLTDYKIGAFSPLPSWRMVNRITRVSGTLSRNVLPSGRSTKKPQPVSVCFPLQYISNWKQKWIQSENKWIKWWVKWKQKRSDENETEQNKLHTCPSWLCLRISVPTLCQDKLSQHFSDSAAGALRHIPSQGPVPG